MKTAALPDTQPAHPMDDIPVRPLRFDFSSVDAADVLWSQSSPWFAMFINALGIDVPHFERFLVRVMREHRDELEDPALLKDVGAIIGQEAHHAFNFKRWTQRLVEKYPPLAAVDIAAREGFEEQFAHKSKKFQIGFVAGYETFTFLGGMIILNRYRELMGDADPVLRAMWVWHQVEEVEHGAVAFDFYRAFYAGHEWHRRWMVIRAFAHISGETFKAYRVMVRGECLYRTPRKALGAWWFFLRFATDLAVAAIPVLSSRYHPRAHPICNDRQNPVAVAWRDFHKAGGETRSLNNEKVAAMLGES